MGTVIQMHSREDIDVTHVEALLARLDWRLDDPCDVSGWAHGVEFWGRNKTRDANGVWARIRLRRCRIVVNRAR